MTDGEPSTVACDAHGVRRASVVCRHLLQPFDVALGFIENCSDPDDLQAWCNACEQMFLREQELTEAFRAFCDMAVVCDACYARLKKLHSAGQA
jgi:hypothetical protein